MSAQHTPGPWEADNGNTAIWAKSKFSARVRIAEIKVPSSTLNGIDHNANARLIAAAPELLEALENAVSLWDFLSTDDVQMQWLKDARAAIAKVRGQS